MRYAYDLDGTLADTRRAVLAAYEHVGVEPPEDFFGKPWHEWLPDPELHKAKNKVYPIYVRKYVEPTLLVSVFKKTGGIIITGASRAAALAVIEKLGIKPLDLFCELRMSDKAEVLRRLGSTGIVFEDSINVCNYLKENTEWTVCHVRF